MAKECAICHGHPDRLKRGLCNRCYERLRKHGLLDGIADDPIPNGAWLRGRGHSAEVLPTTPPPPKAKPGMARNEIPDFVPKIRVEHPVGTRTVWSNGYVGIKTKSGTRTEHKVVMEQILGRPLVGGESVHHRNGDRQDNRAENLELWYRGQPAGQRVSDLIRYIALHHADEMRNALEGAA